MTLAPLPILKTALAELTDAVFNGRNTAEARKRADAAFAKVVGVK